MAVAEPMPTAKATTASVATDLALFHDCQACEMADSMCQTLLLKADGVNRPGFERIR